MINGVADEIGERIRTLFYLDAYAPADGQSLVDITAAETALCQFAQTSARMIFGRWYLDKSVVEALGNWTRMYP